MLLFDEIKKYAPALYPLPAFLLETVDIFFRRAPSKVGCNLSDVHPSPWRRNYIRVLSIRTRKSHSYPEVTGSATLLLLKMVVNITNHHNTNFVL